MNKLPYRSGVLLATAAAALFASGVVTAAGQGEAKEAQIHRSGINACKGQTACKTASNACKGQGWLPTATAEECTAKGGKVLDN